MGKQASTGREPISRVEQLLRDFRIEGESVIRISTGEVVNPAPNKITGYQAVKTAAGKCGERFQIRLHRLKFLLLHGYLPPEVDHANVDGADSSADNLRVATRSQNACNRRRQSNALKYRGVRKSGRKWIATLTFEGIVHRLGAYDSPEKASAVVEAIAEQLHGEFYRSHNGGTQCP